jgi:hypothetical protein
MRVAADRPTSGKRRSGIAASPERCGPMVGAVEVCRKRMTRRHALPTWRRHGPVGASPAGENRTGWGRLRPVLASSSRARLLVLAACIICPVAARAASLSPEEAVHHVGETATVCGLVVSATYLPRAPQSPTFLDLGKPFPNQIFSAIIFGSDRSKFGALETSMRDKTVCVTGEIFLYEGKPKIIVHDPKQLSGG